MSERTLLLITGSPRKKGTSCSFLQTLKVLAEQDGYAVDIIHAIDRLDGRLGDADLAAHFARATLIGIVTPMYVDTLPYPLIALMETMVVAMRSELDRKGLFVVAQYGFPDPKLGASLLRSCGFFASHAGMKWLGGLSYGGGPLINCAALDSLGAKGKRITAALNMLLADVTNGRSVSAEAQSLIAEKIPRILYYPLSWLMNWMAYRSARKAGTDLARKPYAT